MRTSTTRTLHGIALAGLAVALVGCGTAAGTPAPAGPAAADPPAAAAPADPATGSGEQVSANDAGEAEIAAALAAAGVPNADRWADEVVEYRPYPADDAQLTRLRTELDKYDPAPGVVDTIVSVLRP